MNTLAVVVLSAITLAFLLMVDGSWLQETPQPSSQRLLSRHKRFVTFPEGSAVTFLVCCNSVGPYANDIFTFGLDVDMSWDLPNDTRLFGGLPDNGPELQRRERRDVYLKLESLFSAAGMDGRACVLQTLCEVSRRLGAFRGRGGIVEELLRILFTMPASEVPNNYEDWHYDHASGAGSRRLGRECSDLFPGCPISLLDLVLGS